jgi:predicted nucleic-acid-binding protein
MMIDFHSVSEWQENYWKLDDDFEGVDSISDPWFVGNSVVIEAVFVMESGEKEIRRFTPKGESSEAFYF